MKTFRLIVSSPNGNVFEGDAVFLSLRGIAGDLAILAGHTPFVTTVRPCDCKVGFPDDTDRIGHVDGGLLTVSSQAVTLLSGSFRWLDEDDHHKN